MRDITEVLKDPIELQKLIYKCNNKRHVFRELGFVGVFDEHLRRNFNKTVSIYNLDLTFLPAFDRWKDFQQIVKDSDSVTTVLEKLGLSNIGGNRTSVKTRIEKMQLDTSHFSRKRKNVDIFIENSKTSNSTIKTRIIKDGLIEYKCKKCHNKGEWCNAKLTLQLEHKNGCNTDNRLENLEFLCPNCHSQTNTWSGKKRLM